MRHLGAMPRALIDLGMPECLHIAYSHTTQEHEITVWQKLHASHMHKRVHSEKKNPCSALQYGLFKQPNNSDSFQSH